MMYPSHGIFTPHGVFSPVQLLPMLLVLPLIAFWLWMFREMLNDRRLPPGAKEQWTLLFILLNVFAAAIYYAAEYRNRN